MCTRAWVKATWSLLFYFGVTFVHANLCQPANFYNYSKKELQRKTIFFSQFPAGIELSTSEFEDQCLIHWTTAVSLKHKRQKINIKLSSLFPGPSHLFKMAAAFQSKLKVFTARFCYVSHGNATITCYEETFRELGAVKLSPSANRKPLRYENKPRAGASSIVACLVLTEFRRMFYNRVQWGQKKRESRKNGEN